MSRGWWQGFCLPQRAQRFLGLGGTRFWKSCAKLFCWVLAGRDMDSGRGEDDGWLVWVWVPVAVRWAGVGKGFGVPAPDLSRTGKGAPQTRQGPNRSGMEITRRVFQFWRDAPALGQVKRQQREGHCHQDQAQNANHCPGPHVHQLVQPQFDPGQQRGIGAPFMVGQHRPEKRGEHAGLVPAGRAGSTGLQAGGANVAGGVAALLDGEGGDGRREKKGAGDRKRDCI